MNTKDKKPDYKKIYHFVKKQFDKTNHFRHGPFDETYFTLRVYESTKEIVAKISKKVNQQELLVAALLHDIGKTKLRASKLFGKSGLLKGARREWSRHAKLGVPIANKLLRRLGHSEQFISDVGYLIAHHDLRGAALTKKSLALKIIQDADLIADIGFAGFVRPFLFSGKFNKYSVIGSIEFLQKEDRTDLGKNLNLKISRAIGCREMKIQTALARQMAKDIATDLL